jgi:hypothetical protein
VPDRWNPEIAGKGTVNLTAADVTDAINWIERITLALAQILG